MRTLELWFFKAFCFQCHGSVKKLLFQVNVRTDLQVALTLLLTADICCAVPALLSSDAAASLEDGRQPVTILVTVAGADKAAALTRFLDNYETEILLKLQAARLIMVVFEDFVNNNTNSVINNNSSSSSTGSNQSVLNLAQEKAAHFENNYPGYAVRILKKLGGFSRALGLTEGLKACQDSDLVFIVDVDIRFAVEALDSVRKFTRPGRAAYFPVVFSEFRDGGGYWRDFGFGIMAAYKADIVLAGGFNTRIQGWGKEDVDLYSKCLKLGLTITRTTDPHLVHVYHQVSPRFL
jgi:chondroitin sulfate synthase